MSEQFNSQSTTDQFEGLIQQLLEQGYGLSDGFLPPETVTGLRNNLLQLHRNEQMRPAGIGKKSDFQLNEQVRGDVIHWLDPDSSNPFEAEFMGKIAAFVNYLNRTCYTALNNQEFHYAYYEEGSFYKKHLDQFRGDAGRKFSMVLYLNENWAPEEGGELVLYLKGRQEKVLPLAGRLVFFESDKLEHEVLPSPERYRLSIAGWLKSGRP